MAGIPAGISTALVHLDAPVSFVGDEGRIHATITPSVPLVWEATGTPIGNFVDNISLAPGVDLDVPLPHTDQEGFLDGHGNRITSWYYRIEVTYEKDGQTIPFPTRDFQVMSGQLNVDLALIPAGTAELSIIAPILPVTSLDGRTGAVTLEDLNLDLVDNTPDSAKPVSTAQATALAGKAPLTYLSSLNYANINALFAAAEAIAEPVAIKIEKGTHVVTSPLVITKSFRTVMAYGATVILQSNHTDMNVLTVGPDAQSLHIEGGVWDGNSAFQSGTSHVMHFEEYTGAFRIADRTNIVNLTVNNALTDGIRIEDKRMQIQMRHVSVRTFGRYGVAIRSTDCAFDHGAVGIGPTCIWLDGGANWVRNSGIYSADDYGVKLTGRASDCFVVNNMIDNNMGGGLSIVGTAGSTLNTVIQGNSFRGNSRSGDGLFADIYLEQVRNVSFVGNVSGVQQGSTARSSHAITTGAGTGFITASANMFDPNYHLTDIYSDYEAVYSRSRRTDYVAGAAATAIIRTRVGAESFDRFEARADGTMRWGGGTSVQDVNLYRDGVDSLRTDDMFAAPRITLRGTGGLGNLYWETVQSVAPGAPAGAASRNYTRAGVLTKTELVFQTADGLQVISQVAVLTKTANYTLSPTDDLILSNGNALTHTLPDPTAVSPGTRLRIKNLHATNLTVVSAGTTKTIDGLASVLVPKAETVEFITDGAGWVTTVSRFLTSPNGTRFALTVGDDGALTTTSL